jgi:hypothetical protein
VKQNELKQTEEPELTNDEIEQLSSFFDLLAYFDYEDSKKEVVLDSGILVSAPKMSESDSNFSK